MERPGHFLDGDTQPSGEFLAPPIAVHGDSTAIASRIPLLEKYWDLFPQWDAERWWTQLSESSPPRAAGLQ